MRYRVYENKENSMQGCYFKPEQAEERKAALEKTYKNHTFRIEESKR